MWMWLIYICITLVVIAALVIAIIFAPKCNNNDKHTVENCCSRDSIPLEYINGMEKEWFTQGYLNNINNHPSYDYHYYEIPYTGHLYEPIEEDDSPRKYTGHRYERDRDRKPTQYSQMGH